MNFHFRINTNNHIGIGHLMRTFRIATKLQKNGNKCFFYLDYNLRFKNILNNFKTFNLYKKNIKFINQSNDAKLFLNSVYTKEGIVVVDDYRLNHVWEKKVSYKNYKIVVIDDLINNKHFCDYYINAKPDYYLKSNFNHKNILKKNCKMLIGPNYNMIDCTKKNKSQNNFFNLLFYNGGGGNLKQIYNIIKGILEIDLDYIKKIKIIIILGPFSKNKQNILNIAKKNKNIKIINNSFNINKIISSADLIVGSAGNLVYESAFYKIPTLLFQISENQVTDLKSIEKLGHYFVLNKKNFSQYKKVSLLISSMIKNFSRMRKLCNKSEIKIDNKGIDRILKSIFNKKNEEKKIKNNKLNKSKLKKISIRKVNDFDINHYLQSRNLLENRKVSTSKKMIDKIDHYIWWLNSNRNSYILLRGEEKILYFYDEIIKYNNKNYSKQGWFVNSKECTLRDILFALVWQKKMISKKQNIYKSFSVVSKKNKINLSKYLGWENIKKNSNLENIAKKIIGNSKNNYFYSR